MDTRPDRSSLRRATGTRIVLALLLLTAFVLDWLAAQGRVASALLLVAAQLRDWAVRRLKLLLDGLGAHPYLTVALIAALVWRRRIEALLDAVASAIPQREVKLDVKGVKLELGAPDVAAVAGALPIVSRSPFELQRERAVGTVTVLHDLASGIQFDVSDYMGLRYADSRQAVAMRHWRDALAAACKAGDTQGFPTLVANLARSLDESRYCEVDRFMELLEVYADLKRYVKSVQERVVYPGNAASLSADAWVVHAVALGYARKHQWKDGYEALDKLVTATTPFLPAAATYVACRYNAFVDATLLSPAQDLGTEDFFKRFEPVRAVIESLGKRVAGATESDWQAAGATNPSYHKREFLKTAGLVLTFLADETLDQVRSRELLVAGTRYLEQCVQPVLGDPPTGLDFSNLADAYRQQQRFDEALTCLDGIPSTDRDPIFAQARALILVAQDLPWSALQAIQQFPKRDCRSADEFEYYLRNQVLAAQVAAKLPGQAESYRLGLAIDTLRDAAEFGEQHKDKLAGSCALAQLLAMLGAAYLRIPGNEERAVNVLARHAGLDPAPAGSEPLGTDWARQVTLARARVALSRRRRLDRALIDAERERRAAHAGLREAGVRLTALPFEQAQSFRRQSRYFLLHADTALALQELAEECLAQGDSKAAQELSDGPLASVVNALAAGAERFPDLRRPFGAPDDFALQWRLLEARFRLLQGRLCATQDPTSTDALLRAKAEAAFQQALGVDRGLDAAVNVAWGDLLLAVALHGTGDLWASYERALGCFIAATRADDADWRAQAHQRLAEAYAAGPTVRRRAQAAWSKAA